MNYPSEQIPLMSTSNPSTLANTEKVSAAVDMAGFESFMGILLLGDMAAETIDFRMECADDSGFSTNKTTVASITQLAAHASNNDNTQHIIEAHVSEVLAKSATARYVRWRAITGGATGGMHAIAGFGVGPRKSVPTDLTTVGQIVRPT